MSASRRLSQLIVLCLLTVGLTTTGFVTYRHFRILRTLPAIRFSPQPLKLPLSREELSLSGMRWVEVVATPAQGTSQTFRDTEESPGSLILHFPQTMILIEPTRPQRYRGVLYTAIDRSTSASTPPLIQALRDNQVFPRARFAVLMVDRSPWLLWKAVIKETGVLVSGFLIGVLLMVLLARVARPLRSNPVRPAWSRASWCMVILAVGWAVNSGLLRRGPVLPVETIWGLGLGAALALIAVQRKGETK